MIVFVIIYNFCGVGNIDDEKIKIIVDFDFIVEILKKKIIVYFIFIYDNFLIIYLKCLFFLVMLIWMEILIGLG